MKKSLVLLLLASPLFGQGTRHDNIALNTVTINGSAAVQAVQSAVITVCNGTTLPPPGNICTGLATIYSDPFLSSPIPNPTNADIRGNYGFYTPAGNYIVSVSGVFLQTYSYPLVQPCVNTGPCSSGTLSALPLNLTKDGFTHTLTAVTLTAPRTWTLQDSSDTFVFRNTADILTNKTIDVSQNVLKAAVNVAGHVLRNNGTQYIDGVLSASDLSNGVTGSGAVVLTTGPNLSTPVLTTPVINGASTGSGLQGSGAKLQTAGTNSGTIGAILCNDAGGAATTTCASIGFTKIQAVRQNTGCNTGGGSNSACNTDVLTWPTPFADNNYIVVCQGLTTAQFIGQSTTNQAAGLVMDSHTTTTVTVTTETFRSLAAQFSEIHCIGIHP